MTTQEDEKDVAFERGHQAAIREIFGLGSFVPYLIQHELDTDDEFKSRVKLELSNGTK